MKENKIIPVRPRVDTPFEIYGSTETPSDLFPTILRHGILVKKRLIDVAGSLPQVIQNFGVSQMGFLSRGEGFLTWE
jgi:hypothetical protein